MMAVVDSFRNRTSFREARGAESAVTPVRSFQVSSSIGFSSQEGSYGLYTLKPEAVKLIYLYCEGSRPVHIILGIIGNNRWLLVA